MNSNTLIYGTSRHINYVAAYIALALCILIFNCNAEDEPLKNRGDIIYGQVVDLRSVALDDAISFFAQKLRIKLTLSPALEKRKKELIYTTAHDCRMSDAFDVFLLSEKLVLIKAGRNSFEVEAQSNHH